MGIERGEDFGESFWSEEKVCRKIWADSPTQPQLASGSSTGGPLAPTPNIGSQPSKVSMLVVVGPPGVLSASGPLLFFCGFAAAAFLETSTSRSWILIVT